MLLPSGGRELSPSGGRNRSPSDRESNHNYDQEFRNGDGHYHRVGGEYHPGGIEYHRLFRPPRANLTLDDTAEGGCVFIVVGERLHHWRGRLCGPACFPKCFGRRLERQNPHVDVC